MAYKVRFKKKMNVSRVVAKVATVILVLYVGGTIITEIGNVVNGTTSVFNKGFTLIGWTVTDAGLVTSTTSNTGILTVVGIIGVASIILEFVDFRMK